MVLSPFPAVARCAADEETFKTAAMADEKVAARLVGKTVVKTIVVKGRMVNLVVK